jgi:hypothetical protein
MAIDGKTITLWRGACKTIINDCVLATAMQTSFAKAQAQRGLGLHDLASIRQQKELLLLQITDWQGGSHVRNQLKRIW